ncbi:MAG TPA: Mov34/MPN/PAD-1 family protein [Frankiaceae bacterium]|nr:Mov34/MPN/PAD-1 family protein [Frankiaceae bacterium]
MTFEPVGRSFGRPFYDRVAFEGHLRFRGTSGVEVLIAPAVAVQLSALADHAMPNEIGGLVCGRLLADDRGEYTVVLGAVKSDESKVSPGQFLLDAPATTRLRAYAGLLHAGLDVIGWWHSHSGPSGFSNTDRQSQQDWSDPGHVGVLVFARGPEWGVVYAGPGANLLESTERSPVGVALSRPAHNLAPVPNVPMRPRQAEPPVIWEPPGPPFLRRRIVAGVVGITIVALTALVIAAMRSPGAAATRHAVSYGCIAEPGKLTCTSDTPDTVVWFVDGVAVGTANPMTWSGKPGRHRVHGEVRGPQPVSMPVQTIRIPKVVAVVTGSPSPSPSASPTTESPSSSPSTVVSPSSPAPVTSGGEPPASGGPE